MQVVSHHKDLFQQMGRICEIESKLLTTCTRLKHLQKTVSRINQGLPYHMRLGSFANFYNRAGLMRPFISMQKVSGELRYLADLAWEPSSMFEMFSNLHEATDMLRQVGRVLHLVERLKYVKRSEERVLKRNKEQNTTPTQTFTDSFYERTLHMLSLILSVLPWMSPSTSPIHELRTQVYV